MYIHFKEPKRIKEIFDGEKLIYKVNNENEEELFRIGNFGRVNLFVGSNNSGKSRFLRALVKVKENFEVSDKRENVLKYHQVFLNYYNKVNKSSEVLNGLSVIKSLKNPSFDLVFNYSHYQEVIEKYLSQYDNIKKNYNKYKRKDIVIGFKRELELLDSLSDLKKEILFIRRNQVNKKKYIPILRSLHDSPQLRKESFRGTVKEKYGISEDVFTGLSIFDNIQKLKGSVLKDRDKVKQFEIFLSKHFFEGKTVTITPNIESYEILFAVEESEYPVHHIGDGIQSLILILFPIYIANENDWFFIEEPETHLHPGLQRVFIETLLTDDYLKSKNLRFFFTTHSNHFLDTSIVNKDISIFQFTKQNDNTFLIKNNIKPAKSILDALGVNNSSVFLANTSLWVEGPTDRKYLSKFLKLYCKSTNEQYLKEDINFAFFEYGGNLIAHYLFNENEKFDDDEIRENINAFANANKIYLLADNDNVKDGDAKHLRQQNLESLAIENTYFKYQNTVVKEIENLLPVKILKDFIPELLKTESSKKIAKEITFKREDYSTEGIGQFYEDLFKKHKVEEKDFKVFKVQNGTSTTLKGEYKNKLANFVIDGDYTYEDLIEDNDQLKNLIEGLYRFIKNENLTDKG
ncbi:hypothetical protein CXF68_05170 [Tenacibaculum sp. Bg11-29]|uniref:AAA family ATPase n=1 Tax=Tenacibaculum sp. Bg11-29 TaxID=2058306 RepID=UPI000C33DB77|nr:ATP-binding protein [Tenacibaculum sp. Bg11-29]PKH50130.1 hypothetical protein CXF68_05170 [Tenacibaculum sp. Bg11-29]